jgi:hypothetical protein
MQNYGSLPWLAPPYASIHKRTQVFPCTTHQPSHTRTLPTPAETTPPQQQERTLANSKAAYLQKTQTFTRLMRSTACLRDVVTAPRWQLQHACRHLPPPTGARPTPLALYLLQTTCQRSTHNPRRHTKRARFKLNAHIPADASRQPEGLTYCAEEKNEAAHAHPPISSHTEPTELL